jgi:hypothetical protein
VDDRERYDDTDEVHPQRGVLPSFWADENFVGPAAIVNAHRFIFDSRDTNSGERLDILNDREGVWRCRTIFNCTEACPPRDPHHQGDRRGEEGHPQGQPRHPDPAAGDVARLKRRFHATDFARPRGELAARPVY